jgi:hypothetical protein
LLNLAKKRHPEFVLLMSRVRPYSVRDATYSAELDADSTL